MGRMMQSSIARSAGEVDRRAATRRRGPAEGRMVATGARRRYEVKKLRDIELSAGVKKVMLLAA